MDTKKITKLPVLETLPEGAHILVEDGTGTKRVPKAAMTVETDATLTKEGAAADAKATGDAIGEVKGKIGSLSWDDVGTKPVTYLEDVTLNATEPFHSVFQAQVNFPMPLSVGDKVKVIADGNEYIVDAVSDDPYVYFGNRNIMQADLPDTGEPFVFGGDGISTSFALFKTSGDHTVTIIKQSAVPIPNKYVSWDTLGLGEVVETVLMEEQTVTFEVQDSVGQAVPPINIELVEGGTYIVAFDGVVYKSTCQAMEDALYIGNMVSMGFADTGEPFLYGVMQGEDMWLSYDSNAEHTICVKIMAPEIIPVPTKYIAGRYCVGYVDEGSYNVRLLNTEKGAGSKEIIASIKGGGSAMVLFKFGPENGALHYAGTRVENEVEMLVFRGIETDSDQVDEIKIVEWGLPTDPTVLGADTLWNFDDIYTPFSTFAKVNGGNSFYGSQTLYNGVYIMSKIQIENGALVLKDSAGAKWKLVVGTDGTLSTTAATE